MNDETRKHIDVGRRMIADYRNVLVTNSVSGIQEVRQVAAIKFSSKIFVLKRLYVDLFILYTMHNIFSNFLCFASLFAHLSSIFNNINCNDENWILGK